MKKLLLAVLAISLTASFEANANRNGGKGEGKPGTEGARVEAERNQERNAGTRAGRAQEQAADQVKVMADTLIKNAYGKIDASEASTRASALEALIKSGAMTETLAQTLSSRTDMVFTEGGETYNVANFITGEAVNVQRNQGSQAKLGLFLARFEAKLQEGKSVETAVKEALADKDVNISWEQFKQACKLRV